MMPTEQSVAARLNELLALAEVPALDSRLGSQFNAYFDLLMCWNARVNLTAIRDTEGILTRHFVESIICARVLPDLVATALDFGSGAGFPGIPIALCRPEIKVTLAESQAKKAAFLQEAVRTLSLSARVFAGRGETLPAGLDCVTMRAVDRMEKSVALAADLVASGGWLVLMTTERELPNLQTAAGQRFRWARAVALPFAEGRLVAMGQALFHVEH